VTISKGSSWGHPVVRPDELRIAATDAELATLLNDGTGRPVAASGGDLFRTVGSRPVGNRDELMAFPLDLVDVELDGGAPVVAVSHVVARLPAIRGGAWRGPILVVMNAEFIGDADVAPRGHPNDGRVETLVVDESMTVRQRWASRRRLRNATHLPHPQIATRSVRNATYVFDVALRVFADGVDVGAARSITVTVRPDAAIVHS
jgi:hypothetical protein